MMKLGNSLTVSYSGGEEVLLDVGGQDSTEAFEDVGHSDEAREILEGLLVGSLKRQVRQMPPMHTPIPSPTFPRMHRTRRGNAPRFGRCFQHADKFRTPTHTPGTSHR
jgi:hypothetical protein